MSAERDNKPTQTGTDQPKPDIKTEELAKNQTKEKFAPSVTPVNRSKNRCANCTRDYNI